MSEERPRRRGRPRGSKNKPKMISRKECEEKGSSKFKKGVKVGFFLAKNPNAGRRGRGRGSAPSRPSAVPSRPSAVPSRPSNTFQRPRRPARRKKTRLGQLPPQARKGKRNLSTEARKRGIRVTKKSGTRKRKGQLLEEILGG